MGLNWPAKDGDVDLMFVIDGETEDELLNKCETIYNICERRGAVGSVVAESAKDQRDILAIRSNVYTAYKEEFADTVDAAVPPARVPEMINELRRIAAKYNTETPICGHIGDGNIHNFILRENGANPPYFAEMTAEMHEAAIRLGGTLTAEHGIGRTKAKYLGMQFTRREIEIMKAVKSAFDPNNILSPGNIFG